MDRNDDERHEPGPGDRVGLGRVVSTDTAAGGRRKADDVEEASEESFPASDPPGHGTDEARPADREGGAAPPDPRAEP